MAAKNSGWYMNSLSLKFLFSPFKAFYTLFLIIITIFGLSLMTQTYFHQPSLIGQELKYVNELESTPLLSDAPSTVNLKVAKAVYHGLSTLFFDATGINKSIASTDENEFGYRFKKYWQTHYQQLQHLDDTLKVIAIRIGNITIFIGLFFVLSILAVIDGLVMRAIRQKNASRESAGIYHRAKYWRAGITWLTLMLYLCTPIAVSPYILAIPICLSAYMTFLQMKYLKKYL